MKINHRITIIVMRKLTALISEIRISLCKSFCMWINTMLSHIAQWEVLRMLAIVFFSCSLLVELHKWALLRENFPWLDFFFLGVLFLFSSCSVHRRPQIAYIYIYSSHSIPILLAGLFRLFPHFLDPHRLKDFFFFFFFLFFPIRDITRLDVLSWNTANERKKTEEKSCCCCRHPHRMHLSWSLLFIWCNKKTPLTEQLEERYKQKIN